MLGELTQWLSLAGRGALAHELRNRDLLDRGQ